MGFQCQQFYIKDDQCAMKVSTDSLLLGSYVPITNVRRALDMGTGSGLLALMLAQRAPVAQVDGFDADRCAVNQARENVAASPWPRRIAIEQSCVTTWTADYEYDLVVCNPPYFSAHLPSQAAARSLARQGTVAPQEWLKCVARVLHQQGHFFWVLPASQTVNWHQLAESVGLHRCTELAVQTTPKKAAKLVIEGWQWQPPVELKREVLAIHSAAGSYSSAFRQLTGEFYLAGQTT